MKQRMRAAVSLATILVVAVMGVSLFLTVGAERDSRYIEESAWSVGFGDVQSLQVIDLDADGADDLYVQSLDRFSVFDAEGEELWSEELVPPISTTMGDVNGDGAEDLVTFQSSGRIRATSSGDVLWSTELSDIADPARAAVIRFGSGTQVVVGDVEGRLVGLSGAGGSEIWRGAMSGPDAVRGLDDALLDGDRFLVAADRAGRVKMFGADGSQMWEVAIQGLRRMRTYDADGDGRSEVYFGGEQGALYVHDTDGRQLWSQRIGQQVVEIRDGELDGEPSSREIVVGGRSGGVFAFGVDGERLWSAAVGSRVGDVATVDLDDDGADETVIGDESGGLTIFAGRTGARFNLDARRGEVTGIDTGVLGASNQVVVSAGRTVSVLDVSRQSAPFFYTPLVAGLVLSLAIAGTALFLGGLPARLPTRVTVTDSSPEGLLARRRMLHENIADVEELRAQGEIEGPATLAKLESLRGQLAESDQALRRAGVSVAPETMKCPNCGGRVRLGRDKCDYCGEVVLA